MKYFFIITLFLFGHSVLPAQPVYQADAIPADLKKDAHVVKREEAIRFTVKDIDNARLAVHTVYTVLDAEGEAFLFWNYFSDQFTRLDDAEIKVFDGQGKLVNKYKMKELAATAMGDGLVAEGKMYYFRVAAPFYPITVQYDYEVKYKGTLNYPNYRFQLPEMAVEKSAFTVEVPENLDIRYKAQHCLLQPAVSVSGKIKSYVWTATNLPAIPYEAGAVSYESSYPAILLAPNSFSMDDYKGSLATWKDFGLWYLDLSKGSMELPDKTTAYLQALVKNAATDKEKISILYTYLQKNCRYVSIQLGIGGYKPFNAKFVDQKKYGDCKALTNYMCAMLKAVGITSYPALINASYNKQPVDPSFPHNSFNHVILCVPGAKDTTWLECTSNITEPGILGSFTENRNALLITPAGGVLVPTPKSTPSENIFNLHTNITIEEDASGESHSVMRTRGEYKEEVIHYIAEEKKDNQKEYLVRRLGFVVPDAFEISCNRSDEQAATDFSFAIEKVPEFISGSKMFLNPRLYKIWKGFIPETEKRTKAFYLEYPFTKRDTTIYQLPENYTIENLPAPRDLRFEYGTFRTSCSYDPQANTVTSTAFFQVDENVIPADKFKDARHFFSDVIKEYSEKIIIKKK